ncbi:MAG: hypothetical protein ONB12_09935 [candidate division KSB1 bacterium]|nr:hypothetical protein [candidate division KSB1 bacterium]
MPHSVTLPDIRAFVDSEIFARGETLYRLGGVRSRFQTAVGIKGVVLGEKKVSAEVVIDQKQMFGRCTCQIGSGPCEHQTALLIAWVNEPESFIQIDSLRKAVRAKDKETLAETLILLCEAFPELCSLFTDHSGVDEIAALQKEVDTVFAFPENMRLTYHDLIVPLQILTIRAKLFRAEGKYRQARTLYFHLLRHVFTLTRNQRLGEAFTEEMLIDLADAYEELSLADPHFAQETPALRRELAVLDACRPDSEMVWFEELKAKTGFSAG